MVGMFSYDKQCLRVELSQEVTYVYDSTNMFTNAHPQQWIKY